MCIFATVTQNFSRTLCLWGVNDKIQDKEFLTDEKIVKFMNRLDHFLGHFDMDVLDEKILQITYFANSALFGGGAMKMKVFPYPSAHYHEG